MNKTGSNCACHDADPYLCWGKRYLLDIDATSTIRSAVITNGGPCRCWCHDPDEWAEVPGWGDQYPPYPAIETR